MYSIYFMAFPAVIKQVIVIGWYDIVAGFALLEIYSVLFMVCMAVCAGKVLVGLVYIIDLAVVTAAAEFIWYRCIWKTEIGSIADHMH